MLHDNDPGSDSYITPEECNEYILRESKRIMDMINKKEKLLYTMARLMRNTDGLHPSRWGHEAGQMLTALRAIDTELYDRLVIHEIHKEEEGGA